MSYNGSGTFVINTAGQPVVSGTVISSTAFNALTADLATGLSTAITKDGQTTPTANIPMGNNKITGLAVGTAATDAANLSQVQSTAAKLVNSVSGADTITGTMSPNLGAYATGQMFYFVAVGANTGAVTINIDSLGAKSITRDGTTALAAGDIQSGEVCVIVYDGTQFQLVNGASQSASIVTENLTVNKATVLNESGGDNDTRIEGDTDANLFFADASTDRIGIGISSPSEKVHIFGSAAATSPRILIQSHDTASATAGLLLFGRDASNVNKVCEIATSDDDLIFKTNNTTVATLDQAGSLGLGVTPSAWTYFKPLQAVRSGFLGSAGQTGVSYNAYYDGAWKYIANDYALWYSQNATNGQHIWNTAASGTAGNAITFTQAMTLDASGRLGVGDTSPQASYRVTITGGGALNTPTGGITFRQGATDVCYFGNVATDNTTDWEIWNPRNGYMRFATNNTERARISAGGYSKFSSNGTYINSTGTYHEFYQSANADGLRVYCSDSSAYNNSAVIIECARTTTNSTYNLFYVLNGNASGQCLIRDSGNIVNTNGSYGALSDQKLKQDIVDAASQWDDIKSLRVRKYRFKDKPDEALQIGIIAQELEQVSPGLVEESVDRDKEGNDLGTTTKSVKYSVLYMKAVKALQEAMARIEKLEAEVAALKGA